jgi:hypothetical protein
MQLIGSLFVLKMGYLTVYILMNPSALHSKTSLVIALVILNALTIILMAFAFK